MRTGFYGLLVILTAVAMSAVSATRRAARLNIIRLEGIVA